MLTEAIAKACKEVALNVDYYAGMIEAADEAFEHCFGAASCAYASLGICDPFFCFVFCE